METIGSCHVCSGGGKSQIEIGYCKVIKRDNYKVVCLNCGCSGPCCFDKKEAIEEWNKIQKAYIERR